MLNAISQRFNLVWSRSRRFVCWSISSKSERALHLLVVYYTKVAKLSQQRFDHSRALASRYPMPRLLGVSFIARVRRSLKLGPFGMTPCYISLLCKSCSFIPMLGSDWKLLLKLVALNSPHWSEPKQESPRTQYRYAMSG